MSKSEGTETDYNETVGQNTEPPDSKEEEDEIQVLNPPRNLQTASSSTPSDPSNPAAVKTTDGEEENLDPNPQLLEEEEEEVEDWGEDDGNQVIDISKMVIKDPKEARRIAGIILDGLEQDLYEMKEQGKLDRNRRLTDPKKESERRRQLIREHNPRHSLVSNFSDMEFDLDPNKPSTMDLSIEKEKEVKGRMSGGKKVADASAQVSLQRDSKPLESEPDSQPANGAGNTTENFTQTRDFTLLRRDMAKREFTKLYPKPEDWTPPPAPSRNTSLQTMLDLAEDHNPEDNLPQVGPKPKYKRPIQERLLKPQPGDYQKFESYWTGSTFKGDFKGKLFNLGHYDFPTSAKYESEFKEGHIHSKKHLGIITYPRGDTFEGTWRKGRFLDGVITFGDGLKFEPMGWKYCTAPDRRFNIEKTHVVQAIGETFYNDRIPPPHIPYNHYDVGDGIYNPETGNVVNYQGVLLRKVTEYEHRWIVLNCRKRKSLLECYQPLFMEGREPDRYAHIYPQNT